MQIDLFDILSQPGSSRSFSVPVEWDAFSTVMGSYPVKERMDMKLTFTHTGNKVISLSSDLDLLFTAPCDRCLDEVEVHVTVNSVRELNYGEVVPDADETLEDMPFVDGTNFDSDQYAYCEVLENFPMKVLCSPDCKGICNVCGKNMNHGSCDCDRQVLDPRMSKIRDIFQQFSE